LATTTVVIGSFYEQLTEALKRMQEDPRIGELSLAMLVPSPILDNTWSLALASKALDQLSLRQATELVLRQKEELLGKDAQKIDTVRILRTNSPAVRDLGNTFQISQIGTSYQAHGMLPVYLNLVEPILFVAKAA
jgi:hypothetical protein